MSPTEGQRSPPDSPWLVGLDNAAFWHQLERRLQQLQAEKPTDILLVEADPMALLASFFAASQVPCRLWLADPAWGRAEWQQVAAQVTPDRVWGTVPQGFLAPSNSPPMRAEKAIRDRPTFLIPTGGSSGHLRFAHHTWDTLTASVRGFQQHFGVAVVNAYCVLPLHHVSGLMQAVRCWLTGGWLAVQPFKALQQQEPLPLPPGNWFLSLVPTQLQRLLTAAGDRGTWLRQFHAILLGGAPPWPALLEAARAQALPLAPTYGMTETAAQIATLLPKEFLAGNPSSGRPLPHAQITIRDAAGAPLPPNQPGLITVQATSLALTIGTQPLPMPFQPGDVGYQDGEGYLHVLGRQNHLIISGGEKILPEEVEAAILATGLVPDVVVLGLPDEDWGEVVVAVFAGETQATAPLRDALKAHLSPYKVPKHWLWRSPLPRNAQGKINRVVLRTWAQAQLR